MAKTVFSWSHFSIRLVSALVLVFCTYNPTGVSYIHCLMDTLPAIDVLVIFVGIVFIIGWAVFLRASLRSLGTLGTLLAIAFFGTLLWLVISKEWIAIGNLQAITWLVLLAVSCFLAVGMSWSHIRRRMSGQLDVDDADS